MERQNIHIQIIMLTTENEDFGIRLKIILKLEKLSDYKLVVIELKLV